ncbi:MAG TPA: hydroxymethylglutaryl-CoA reductase [Ktedonosporobacter sp.]|nr:hydroxymethylglutaryl-CoA reductase [Ktedonosporobacter sp.]
MISQNTAAGPVGIDGACVRSQADQEAQITYHSLPARISTEISAEDTAARWRAIPNGAACCEALLDTYTVEHMDCFQGNIENFIGTVKVPVGLAGPLRVSGLFAQGDYLLPLATTEAALVASYHRGAQLITEVGGCSAMLLDEGVGRAPGFAFRSLEECRCFLAWTRTQWETLQYEASQTTRYGKLIDMRATIEGNHLYLHFDFATADAAGQNMVTIASEAICAYLLQHSPIKPQYSFLEANFSGDKKASAQSLQRVRGKRVSAEVQIPAELVRERLHTSPQRMADFWRMGTMGAVLSGTIGAQGHFANGLAALYIACGQDAACVAESAVGVTRLEVTSDGSLYAAVTLPNLIVGTVGGGTGLPGQHACLDILKLAGAGKARALAEVCAGLCLAGEISLVAAICAGHFARAHKRLARGRVRKGGTA